MLNLTDPCSPLSLTTASMTHCTEGQVETRGVRCFSRVTQRQERPFPAGTPASSVSHGAFWHLHHTKWKALRDSPVS